MGFILFFLLPLNKNILKDPFTSIDTIDIFSLFLENKIITMKYSLKMKGFGEYEKYNNKIQKNNKNSEKQLINQAIQFHLKGNISEAKKYYQIVDSNLDINHNKEFIINKIDNLIK